MIRVKLGCADGDHKSIVELEGTSDDEILEKFDGQTRGVFDYVGIMEITTSPDETDIRTEGVLSLYEKLIEKIKG